MAEADCNAVDGGDDGREYAESSSTRFPGKVVFYSRIDHQILAMRSSFFNEDEGFVAEDDEVDVMVHRAEEELEVV